MSVRTALVTARSAPSHERAIRTRMDWRINLDEAVQPGGPPPAGRARGARAGNDN